MRVSSANRKPTVIKKLFGNPGKRPLNDQEPEPTDYKMLPPAPDYLGEAAKKEWKRLGKELIKMGVISKASITCLGAYCSHFEQWVNAYRIVIEQGSFFTAPNGEVKQHPALSVVTKQLDSMRKWMNELGVTPSSMSGLRVKKEKVKKETEKEDYFG